MKNKIANGFKIACITLTTIAGSQAASAEDNLRVVAIVNTTAGMVIADANDLSLYTFDSDESGVSNCYDRCASIWPPALTALSDLTPPFGKTERKDGTSQLTYNGAPLYRFTPDQVPGDIKGDGVGGVWHLARIQPLP